MKLRKNAWKKKKDLINTAFAYSKFLNTLVTQYDKFSIAQKKRVNILNKPENVTPDLYLDEDLMPLL